MSNTRGIPREKVVLKGDGCRYAESCFACPFEDCLQGQKADTSDRDRKIRNLARRGRTYQAIAEEFGITKRTVSRIITRR